MAVMLVKADGLTAVAENNFRDLAEHPNRDDILRTVEAKILTGYPDGTFRPGGNTTRYEAVAALVNYLLGGEPTDEMCKNLKMSFTDIPGTHWAYKHILLAVNGYTELPN
jgi:hypothetical protein